MIHLLDVNVLIALADANHPHHAVALRFFQTVVTVNGWATCPLTENAFIRILGGAHYTHGPRSTDEARRLLNAMKAAPGHQFWPDELSLSDSRFFPKLPASQHLTDLYLLALAVKHGARFATFDSGIAASLVPGGPATIFLILSS